VESVAVQHQIRHDMLELIGLEDDQGIADRVRSARRITELFDFDIELLADRGAHALGDGAGLRRVIIDVGVIAQIRDGLRGLLGHRTALPAGWRRYAASWHSDTRKSIQPSGLTPPSAAAGAACRRASRRS